MRVIKLDGREWKTPLDFLQALFDGIEQGYPHGLSVNAFVDSMVWGGMGGAEPPYKVLIANLKNSPREVKDEVSIMIEAIARHRRERFERDGIDVEVSIVAPELSS